MDCIFLCPYPQELKASGQPFPKPRAVTIVAPKTETATVRALAKDLSGLAGIAVRSKSAFHIRLAIKNGACKAEGYRLELTASGATITASDSDGLFYGTQTLLQFFVLGKAENFRQTVINDWPQYKLRSFMVDPGRAPYSMALLNRTVRILSRLKMNLLHVHIMDDELCGLRFKKLPLGSENPTAITLAQLKDLIQYARGYHVSVMPEIECWGHAGSAIYHFPNLYGAPGMWGGMSFGIGEETFQLFEKIFDELVPVLEKKCLLHVGLDEACWALLKSVPEDEKANYSPAKLVTRIYDIVQAAGRKHKRRISIHLWADHGGRPLEKRIQDKVVIEPWRYFQWDSADIIRKLEKYGGKGKTPMMMGAGMSSAHLRGHFGATRVWCQNGRQYPNVQGVTICMWTSNDLAGQLLGLYGGADYAWSPDTPVKQSSKPDEVNEIIEGEVMSRMRLWQAKFKDADTEAIDKDRGPEAFAGFYLWGKLAGTKVAPTAGLKTPEEIVAGAEM